MLHLAPAFGRDYKSKAEVEAALKADLHFLIADQSHPSDGRTINRPQILELGYRRVQIRFKRLRSVAIFSVS